MSILPEKMKPPEQKTLILIIVSDDTYSYNARNSEGKCVFYEELVIR